MSIALNGYDRLDVPADLNSQGDRLDSAIVTRELPLELTNALAAVNAANGDTMFNLSLSACLAALHVATGRPDVSVATPVANRNASEVEDLVGPLVNHVVLKARVTPTSTLAEVLDRVRDATLDAMSDQDAPLERLAQAFKARYGSAPDPFFSICFACQRGYGGTRAVTYDFAGLHMKTLPSKTPGALHDLFFFMVERENGWRISLDYAVARFSEPLASRLLDTVIWMLEQYAAKPLVRLNETPERFRPHPVVAPAPSPVLKQPKPPQPRPQRSSITPQPPTSATKKPSWCRSALPNSASGCSPKRCRKALHSISRPTCASKARFRSPCSGKVWMPWSTAMKPFARRFRK